LAKNHSSNNTPLLPQGVSQFAIDLSTRIVGAGLWIMFALLVAALVSHNPADPALNSATDAAPHNWLGEAGAMASDILLQTIGLAAFLLCLPLAGWGWRLLSLRGLPWIWQHLILLPFMVLLSAAALTSIPPAPDWPLETGYGGYLGQLIFNTTGRLVFDVVSYFPPSWALGALFGALGLLSLPFVIGLDRYEWQAMAQNTRYWAVYVARLPLRLKKTRAGAGEDAPPKPSRPHVTRPIRAADSAADAPTPSTKRAIATKTTPAKGKRAARERQTNLDLGETGIHNLPPLDLLVQPKVGQASGSLTKESLEQNARLLESVLDDFGIRGEIVAVRPGPVVTLYELEPAPGTKSARVIGLADDIARSMSAVSARVAVVPGRNAIGIELPNQDREIVYLRELLESDAFESPKNKLPLVLGKDIGGAPVIADLSGMPHLLVAGTTGAGKSVGLNAMILSLLYKLSPAECRFIMVDPKMLELSIYDGIPHLLTPVVTEAKKAVVALKWAVREMEERYRAMSKLRVRNISAYNKRVREANANGEALSREVQTGFDEETGQPIFESQEFQLEPLPLIVIVIDEMADLMLVAGKDVEATIQRLAQMARAAGLHVIMATQRPSVDVITGTIKANFPTRIAFQVTSKIDSRTILGEMGAEQLLGKGDMLFMAGGGRVTRVHGPFVSDDEVEQVVEDLKKQGSPEYLSEVTEEPDEGFDSDFLQAQTSSGEGSSENELYDQAVAIVLRDRKASTSYIQRRLKIGYNKAATLIEDMEDQGVISAPNHAGKREILVPERPE